MSCIYASNVADGISNKYGFNINEKRSEIKFTIQLKAILTDVNHALNSRIKATCISKTFWLVEFVGTWYELKCCVVSCFSLNMIRGLLNFPHAWTL